MNTEVQNYLQKLKKTQQYLKFARRKVQEYTLTKEDKVPCIVYVISVVFKF